MIWKGAGTGYGTLLPCSGKAGEEETIYRTIEEAGIDVMTRRRLEAGRADGTALPGALWHIFDSCDSDAIRDLLNKVAQEIGEPIDADHDPIHDQVRSGFDNLSTRMFVLYPKLFLLLLPPIFRLSRRIGFLISPSPSSLRHGTWMRFCATVCTRNTVSPDMLLSSVSGTRSSFQPALPIRS